MELIDKDAVIAEIERLQDSIASTVIDNRINKEHAEAYEVCVKLRSFIEDTLEVKEVNLELNSFDATVCKNGNTYLKEMDKDAIIKAIKPYKDGDKVKVIIKSQKGESHGVYINQFK